MEAQSQGERAKDIPVVCGFGDLFLKELPGLFPVEGN